MNRLFISIIFVFITNISHGQNELVFFGEDDIEVTTYKTLPSPVDNTHFGNVDIGNSKILIFKITNNYLGFLSFFGITLGAPQISGLDASEYSVTNPLVNHLNEGESTTFTITLSPTSTGIKDATITFSPILWFFPLSENSLNIRGIVNVPAISIFDIGNNRILSNSLPNINNNTDFGVLNFGQSETRTFQIRNEGSENLSLDLNSLIVNESKSGEYSYNSGFIPPTSIAPGSFVEFNLKYEPMDNVEDTFMVSYLSNDPEVNPFIVNLIGNGFEPQIPDIMITQFYENGNNNDYIEIKNLSNTTIPSQTYYLAHYRRNRNLNGTPNRNIAISSLAQGEVKTYNNFRLRGNDIVIISTSNGLDCYADRVDIIGNQNGLWGNNRSFTKGGCASESPHLNFDVNDWVEIEVAKVDVANNRQNIALGTYNLGAISWNGSDWSNNALPDLSTIAIIDGSYNANIGNIEACDLIINSDLNFDNNTTNTVIVYRDLIINGTFTIGDQESLVMYDDFATINGNITKKESSTIRNNIYDFTYWSSPIENATIGSVYSGVTQSRIFLYDQSQSSASDPNDPTFWNTWVVASGTMKPGFGYATEGLTGTTGKQDISFVGKPNNGRIFVNIFENNDSDFDNDFNFIGNPYPSAINIENFFDLNVSVIDPTVYLWTHNTPISNGDSGDYSMDDYATYNYMGGTGVGGPVPDKNIGSSQGFFVRAINAGTAEFNNSMRLENSNDQFFKSSNKKNKIALEDNKDRIWLNLTTDKAGFNQILIGFTDKATLGVDSGYDALKIEGDNSISFYSTIESEKYSIQGLNIFSNEMTVDLGFNTKVSPRIFSVSIDNIEGVLKNSEVYLVDKQLDIIHNLKESDYDFEVNEEGNNPDRFMLQFKGGTTLSVDELRILNNDFIISQDDGLKINSQQFVQSIRVFDILGRKLIDQKPNKKSFKMATGTIKKGTILLIEATLEDSAVISKKTIKY